MPFLETASYLPCGLYPIKYGTKPNPIHSIFKNIAAHLLTIIIIQKHAARPTIIGTFYKVYGIKAMLLKVQEHMTETEKIEVKGS